MITKKVLRFFTLSFFGCLSLVCAQGASVTNSGSFSLSGEIVSGQASFSNVGNEFQITASDGAVISYENFDFSDNVVIVKKSRDFNLKSKTLFGNFNKGNYNTNDQVDIVSRNISIKGNGLIVRNNGDYMKVKGKAFLEMLY